MGYICRYAATANVGFTATASGGRTRYLGLGQEGARLSARASAGGGKPVTAKHPVVVENPPSIAFRQAVDDYISAHQAMLRNAKHRQQWCNTLDTYATPLMGMPGDGFEAARQDRDGPGLLQRGS